MKGNTGYYSLFASLTSYRQYKEENKITAIILSAANTNQRLNDARSSKVIKKIVNTMVVYRSVFRFLMYRMDVFSDNCEIASAYKERMTCKGSTLRSFQSRNNNSGRKITA